MNTPKTARPRAVYQVTFQLEVTLSPEQVERDANDMKYDQAAEMLVEEAVRCGLNFKDASGFKAKFLEVKS